LERLRRDAAVLFLNGAFVRARRGREVAELDGRAVEVGGEVVEPEVEASVLVLVGDPDAGPVVLLVPGLDGNATDDKQT